MKNTQSILEISRLYADFVALYEISRVEFDRSGNIQFSRTMAESKAALETLREMMNLEDACV